MNMQKNLMSKSAMTYGLYLGLAFVVVNALFWLIGKSFSGAEGYIHFLASIAIIFLGAKTFRDNEPGGFISYGRALGYGVLTSLYAALIFAFWTFVLFSFLDPELLTILKENTESAYLNLGMDEDLVEQQMALYNKVLSPGFYAFGLIFSKVLYGFLYSLIIAAFVKRNNPNPFASVDVNED